MTKIGVMVCGHGSRDEGAVSEFDSVAAGIRERLPQYQVEKHYRRKHGGGAYYGQLKK